MKLVKGDRLSRHALAIQILNEIDALSVVSFNAKDYRVHEKSDGSPVTDFELFIETMIVDRIESEFPEDAILGEETGVKKGSTGKWIVDPIDGTSNFLERVPIYAHMISFIDGPEPDFAFVSAPMMDARWSAISGNGAYRNSTPVTVSNRDKLADSQICYGGVRDYDDESAELLIRLARKCRRSRGYGNFLAHMLVAEGTYELAASAPGNAEWDLTPIRIILQEAGGRMSSFRGGPENESVPIISSNGILHSAVVSMLSGTSPI